LVPETISFWFNHLCSFPWKSGIVLTGVFFVPILILNIIYGLIISPLICKFYIVPQIEKKVGKKLGYSYLLSLVPFGRFFNRGMEISAYILNRYYAFKKYGERGLPSGCKNLALKQVGYTIDMISKSELIFAFSIRINMWVGSISFIIAFIAAVLSHSS